jgi:hypothetical protein
MNMGRPDDTRGLELLAQRGSLDLVSLFSPRNARQQALLDALLQVVDQAERRKTIGARDAKKVRKNLKRIVW